MTAHALRLIANTATATSPGASLIRRLLESAKNTDVNKMIGFGPESRYRHVVAHDAT
jgi:hypothetical protein